MSPKETGVVRVGLLGCGTVGSQVARLLTEQHEDLSTRAGARIELAGIAVRSLDSRTPPWVDRDLLTEDAAGLAARCDVVVELIGGIEPPRSLVRTAMENGASVVTANKALLAEHGPELYDLAAERGVDLYYEAAVAGAVPVVYALRESLAGDKVTRVLGIVNGTTNYILDEMTTKGLDFDTALSAAQELGYAEADPTADVDGIDAANKAAILASLAFHTRVSLSDVDCRGIRDVTAEDVAQAAEDGYVIKLLAVAERREDAPRGATGTATAAGTGAAPTSGARGISVRVHPALVPLSHPLAAVHGPFNAVVTESEASGRLMFYGAGAGGTPTASAVLGDLVAAAHHKVHGGAAPRELAYASLPLLGRAAVRTRAQIRLSVADVPGALSEVAGVCARHGVSISAVRQISRGDHDQAVVLLTTHTAEVAALDAVLDDFGSSPAVREVLATARIIED